MEALAQAALDWATVTGWSACRNCLLWQEEAQLNDEGLCPQCTGSEHGDRDEDPCGVRGEQLAAPTIPGNGYTKWAEILICPNWLESDHQDYTPANLFPYISANPCRRCGGTVRVWEDGADCLDCGWKVYAYIPEPTPIDETP